MSDQSPSPRKVLLLGWDAADWKVINPLIDQGKMPNLARLVEGGVMGNIATLQPVLSPMLWTSIATGKRPQRITLSVSSTPESLAQRQLTITRVHTLGWVQDHEDLEDSHTGGLPELNTTSP